MLRSDQELLINWWTKKTDDMDPKTIARLDYNARRRIDTQLAKDKTMGNEFEKVGSTEYECHWRVIKKRK